MFRARSLVAWLTAMAVTTLAPESFSAPFVAAASAPVLGANAEKVENVQLKTEDGLDIAGSLYLPKKRSGRAPAVLMVHGPGSDSAQLVGLAQYLRKRGFAVLSLDLRGHGQSATGETPFNELARDQQERMWTFTLRDLDAGATFLRARRDIHTTNLTLIGVGSGCGLALRHASEDENARAVVLLSPVEDQLGFCLPDEVRRCGGLPTLLVSPKDGRPLAKRLVDGLIASGDDPDIQLAVLKSSGTEYLADKRLPSEVANYLRDTVIEKRGR